MRWLVVILGFFVTLKLWYLAPRFSDGNVYAYLGQRVMEGSIPYRDFFYSSPPLLLYVFGIVGLLFNWQWWAWAALPLMASVVDAGLIYCIAKRWWSKGAAVVAAVSYLFSFVILATTDYATDVHFMVTLILLALVAQMKKRLMLSGLLLALAVLVKLYAVVLMAPLLGWFAWQAWQEDEASVARWRVLKIIGVFVSVLALVTLGLWMATGAEFYRAVILNNLGRGIGIPREQLLPFIFWHDLWLLVVLVVPIVVRRWIPGLFLLCLGAVAIFLLVYPDVYYLYFKLAAPWLALLWGWAYFYLSQDFGRGVRMALVGGLVIYSVATSFSYVRQQAREGIMPDPESIAAYVRGNVEADEVLYGDFDVAPLIALQSDRRLWRDMADTNIKFFLNETFNADERMKTLADARIPLLVTKGIVNGKNVVGGYEQTVTPAFIHEYCHVGQIFPQQGGVNAVVVWRCVYQ